MNKLTTPVSSAVGFARKGLSIPRNQKSCVRWLRVSVPDHTLNSSVGNAPKVGRSGEMKLN